MSERSCSVQTERATLTAPHLSACTSSAHACSDLGQNRLSGPLPAGLLANLNTLNMLAVRGAAGLGCCRQLLARCCSPCSRWPAHHAPDPRSAQMDWNQISGPLPPEWGSIQASAKLAACMPGLRNLRAQGFVDCCHPPPTALCRPPAL